MEKIEQAREVSLRLKRAPLQNGSNFHSEVADVIDALLAELAALSLDLHTETAAVIALRAELDEIKSQEPAWKENELESMFGTPHKAYYLAAGAQPVQKPLPAHEIVTMYSEQPQCDADMVEFARSVEQAHGIKETS